MIQTKILTINANKNRGLVLYFIEILYGFDIYLHLFLEVVQIHLFVDIMNVVLLSRELTAESDDILDSLGISTTTDGFHLIGGITRYIDIGLM